MASKTVSPKTLDRRSRRTRSMLQNALLQLLESKPLNKITVTELTALADVNRATFYAHYTDIYEMFDELKLELIGSIKAIIARHGDEIASDDFGPLIREIFQFSDTHAHMFSLMVGSQGDATYADIIASIDEYCTRTIDPVSIAGPTPDMDRATAELVRSYQFSYIAGGIVSVLRAWFVNGREEPIELMAAITAATTGAAGIDTLTRNLRIAATMRR